MRLETYCLSKRALIVSSSGHDCEPKQASQADDDDVVTQHPVAAVSPRNEAERTTSYEPAPCDVEDEIKTSSPDSSLWSGFGSLQVGDNAYVCRCQVREPRIVRLSGHLLGSLLIRVTGDPQAVLCNISCCKRENLTWSLTYYVPRWMLGGGFGVSMLVSNPSRIGISLSFPRLLPPDADFFVAIRNGDCGSIQKLLSSGRASVFDIVAPYGLTPVDLSILYGQAETRRLLVANGAEQLPSPPGMWLVSDVFTYFKNCSLIESSLSAGVVVSDVVRLQARCHDEHGLNNYIEVVLSDEACSTPLHKIVLGLSLQPLEDLLTTTAAAAIIINTTDAFQRTALHWAVETRHRSAVASLLLRGADPCLGDSCGMTPLHLAASQGDLPTIDMLIQAGANLEAADKFGCTSLHFACTTGDTATITHLLDRGADIGAQNMYGEGVITLAVRAFNRASRNAALFVLLARGATLNGLDHWGCNQLSDAIFMSSAETVAFLVRSMGLDACRQLMPGAKTVLHVAARNADLPTIEALLGCAAQLDVDPDAVDSNGLTAREYLERRKDAAALSEPFCALLATVGGYRRRREMGPRWCDEEIDDDDNELFFDAEEYIAVTATSCE